jgi:hypothetical protein
MSNTLHGGVAEVAREHLAPGARAEARRRPAWGAVTVLMAAGGVKQRGRSFP